LQADLEQVFVQVMRAGLMDGFRTLFYKELLRFWKVSFQTVRRADPHRMLYLLIFLARARGTRRGLPRCELPPRSWCPGWR